MLVPSLATGPRSDSNLRGGFLLFEGILHRPTNLVNMLTDGRTVRYSQSVRCEITPAPWWNTLRSGDFVPPSGAKTDRRQSAEPAGASDLFHS